MFASHLVMPFQEPLTSHVWGRFMGRTLPAGPPGSAPAAGGVAEAAPARLADEEPDLAQRVRELGEW
ncbi:hypothetical protein [Comamonas granuli]|uniref:hypothetical protein n=1 Tax=Comamonas granuli TaxID=290309 RepID=UPI0005A7CEE3|nr:hypothetical protein [Comamonas granuli]